MKYKLLFTEILIGAILGVSCGVVFADTPMAGLRLTTDMNAGGNLITNLGAGFAASIGALTNGSVVAEPIGYTALTNAATAQDTANAALPKVATNGWTVSSHTGFLTAESDPKWAAVSNTVTSGAALGATALQASWATTGTVSRAEAASMLESENGKSWIEFGSNGVAYVVQVTNTTDIYVVSTSGDGYNGPAVGTVFQNPEYDGSSYGWYWGGVSGFTVYTTPDGLELFDNHIYLVEDDGQIRYGSGVAVPLPVLMTGGSLSEFVLDWVPSTNYYQIVTEPTVISISQSLIDAHNGNTAAHLDLARASTITNMVHDIATSLVGSPYVLQGSVVVPTDAYSITLSGVAQNNPNGTIAVIPYQATRPSEIGSTGTVLIATSPDVYIVDVSADMYVSSVADASLPMTYYPVEYELSRIDETNWTLAAWCPGALQTYASANGYFAMLSNLVVYTYSRPGYRPNTLTNDTAALPTFADALPMATSPSRRVVPAGSIRDYIDGRKLEIAKYAWRTTPRGAMSPDPNVVVIDQPLVQQGAIAFLQTGDYYCFFYAGGDWRQTETGSKWQVGASGREDFSITSDSRMGHVFNFSVSGDVAYIYASTNWMAAASLTGLPADADVWAERSYDLVASQWLACPDYTATYHVDAANGDYWLFTAPATAQRTFYRIMIGGGLRRINSKQTHEFYNGVRFDGHDYTYNIMTYTNGTDVLEIVGRRLP